MTDNLVASAVSAPRISRSFYAVKPAGHRFHGHTVLYKESQSCTGFLLFQQAHPSAHNSSFLLEGSETSISLLLL